MNRPSRLRLLTICAVGGALLAGTPGAAGAAENTDPIFPSPSPSTPAPPPRPTYGTCSVTAPARVAVAARATQVPITLSSDCPAGAYARWDVVDPRGVTVQRLSFPPSSGRAFTVTAARTLGVYRLRPVTANDASYTQLAQNRPTIAVGARSRTAVKAVRSGRTVTVAATTSSYSVRAGAFAPRAKARVVLQRSSCASGCTWTNAGAAVSDARGRATFRASSPARAYWRTYVGGTPSVWGSISTPVRG